MQLGSDDSRGPVPRDWGGLESSLGYSQREKILRGGSIKIHKFQFD